MKAFLGVFPETTLWYDGASVLLMGRWEAPLQIEGPELVRRGRGEAELRELWPFYQD